jgi:hypothetical protein
MKTSENETAQRRAKSAKKQNNMKMHIHSEQQQEPMINLKFCFLCFSLFKIARKVANDFSIF